VADGCAADRIISAAGRATIFPRTIARRRPFSVLKYNITRRTFSRYCCVRVLHGGGGGDQSDRRGGDRRLTRALPVRRRDPLARLLFIILSLPYPFAVVQHTRYARVGGRHRARSFVRYPLRHQTHLPAPLLTVTVVAVIAAVRVRTRAAGIIDFEFSSHHRARPCTRKYPTHAVCTLTVGRLFSFCSCFWLLRLINGPYTFVDVEPLLVGVRMDVQKCETRIANMAIRVTVFAGNF